MGILEPGPCCCRRFWHPLQQKPRSPGRSRQDAPASCSADANKEARACPTQAPQAACPSQLASPASSCCQQQQQQQCPASAMGQHAMAVHMQLGAFHPPQLGAMVAPHPPPPPRQQPRHQRPHPPPSHEHCCQAFAEIAIGSGCRGLHRASMAGSPGTFSLS